MGTRNYHWMRGVKEMGNRCKLKKGVLGRVRKLESKQVLNIYTVDEGERDV